MALFFIHKEHAIVLLITCLFKILCLSYSTSLKAKNNNTTTIIKLDTVLISDTELDESYPINTTRSITHFNQNTISELSFKRTQDISGYIPSYYLNDTGTSGAANRSSIRGLTNTPIYTTPSISLYIDDVPHLSSYNNANQLTNIGAIEVYNGPQGALFGRNSYAGVINIKSRKPDNQTKSNAAIEYGNFNSLHINSHLSGAFIQNQLYFSSGITYFKQDGYLKNTFHNKRQDYKDNLSGRMALTWVPNALWEIKLKAYLQDFNDGAVRLSSLANRKNFQTQSGDPENQKHNENTQALKIRYQNDYFKILSITSRRNARNNVGIDLDLSPQSLAFLRATIKQQQWSQELRFQSLTESAWHWSFGLFYSDNTTSGNRKATNPMSSESVQLKTLNETTYAIFGQVSYAQFDAWRIFLDLRLDYVEKKINSTLNSFTGQFIPIKDQNSDIFVSPKLTISHTLSPNISAYVSTGHTFRPGGFSGQSAKFSAFKKETMWHNEIGIKSAWLRNQFNANASIYYYDIKNYQLEEIFSPADYTVINVPKTTSYGAEINLAAKITNLFKINGSFSYTHIQFDKYIDRFNGKNLAGKRAPYVPTFNANIAGIFKHPSGFYARTDLLWTGKNYYDTSNSRIFSERDYPLLNITLGYKHKYFDIQTYVKNLTNTKYFSSKLTQLNFGTTGAPRVFGARINFQY